jgi:FkbM family methyltransferase
MSMISNAPAWMAKIGPFTYWWRMATRQFAKRIIRHGLELTLPNGRRVYLPPDSGFSAVAWVTRGAVDDGCEELLRALGEAGSAFFDVGAHFGFYCVFLGDRHKPVVAFEPNTQILKALRRNLAGIADSVCIAEAVSDRSGTLRFAACHSSPESRVLDDGADAAGASVATVKATTIDETWQRLNRPRVGVIKIDTEGHEAGVLAGARETIEACQPLMLIEASSCSLSPHVAWLGGLGYVGVVLSSRQHGEPQRIAVVQLGEMGSAFIDGMILLVPRQTQQGAAWEELSAGRFAFKMSPSNSAVGRPTAVRL